MDRPRVQLTKTFLLMRCYWVFWDANPSVLQGMSNHPLFLELREPLKTTLFSISQLYRGVV